MDAAAEEDGEETNEVQSRGLSQKGTDPRVLLYRRYSQAAPQRPPHVNNDSLPSETPATIERTTIDRHATDDQRQETHYTVNDKICHGPQCIAGQVCAYRPTACSLECPNAGASA